MTQYSITYSPLLPYVALPYPYEVQALLTIVACVLLGITSLVARSYLYPPLKNWRWFTLIPVMLVNVHLSVVSFAGFTPQPSSDLHIKIMSFNVCANNRQTTDMLDLIKQEQPDLLLLQEMTPYLKDLFTQALVSSYPVDQLHVDFIPKDQQMIISRYPLTSVGVDVDQGRVQKVTVDTPEGPVLVWNVHASRMNPWEPHYQQLKALAEAIQSVQAPLIVGGDFNAPDESVTYKLISQQLQDAQRVISSEISPTFPALTAGLECKFTIMGMQIPPIVRIDHIFYSKHFTARGASTLSTSGGSDHLPITAELALQ